MHTAVFKMLEHLCVGTVGNLRQEYEHFHVRARSLQRMKIHAHDVKLEIMFNADSRTERLPECGGREAAERHGR